MAQKRGYEPIHHRWVQDEQYRSGPKELGRSEEFCRELGKLENAGGSTREERERHNMFWVFRQTDVSFGQITTATSAHTHHSKMCADFRPTKNAVAAASAAYPTQSPLDQQRQQWQRPQPQQQSQQWQVWWSSHWWHDQSSSSWQGRNSS